MLECASYILVTRLFVDGREFSVNMRCGLTKPACEKLVADMEYEVLPKGWTMAATCEERMPLLDSEKEVGVQGGSVLADLRDRMIEEEEP